MTRTEFSLSGPCTGCWFRPRGAEKIGWRAGRPLLILREKAKLGADYGLQELRRRSASSFGVWRINRYPREMSVAGGTWQRLAHVECAALLTLGDTP
jgi:hypothetical protein